MAQNDAKDAPKRLEEAPKRSKKVIPNRKTKKGPNQDDPKSYWEAPSADQHRQRALPWAPFGKPKRHQNRPLNDQKSNRKFKMKKEDPRQSWTCVGAILGRSWPHIEVHVGQKVMENVMFRDTSIF